jgi:hypothetical protein
MQGRLGDKLFPDLVRDLSRENTSGRLTITHSGETIEIFFESGVPVQATSSLADDQLECGLVRDGLASSEQIKAAWLAANDSSLAIDAVLVDSGVLTTQSLHQAQLDLSRTVINSVFEWYTGEYEFDAERGARGPKLTWNAAECILGGARHASANDAILEVIAPDYKVIAPAPYAGCPMEQSATLSSVEGYVLSCIQSPISIWEASGLTGLSHSETRRALFILILLGLLVEHPITSEQHVPSGHGATAAQVASTQDATEENEPAVQWCPVEYASGDCRDHLDYGEPAEYDPATEHEDIVGHASAGSRNEDEYGNSYTDDVQNEYEDQLEQATESSEGTTTEEIGVTIEGDSAATLDGYTDKEEDEREDQDRRSRIVRLLPVAWH